MGLLKTVFEVNLQLFLKTTSTIMSLPFPTVNSLTFFSHSSTSLAPLFVSRDHIGTTPLSNLRPTLLADLTRIWSTSGSNLLALENSKIEDYF